MKIVNSINIPAEIENDKVLKGFLENEVTKNVDDLIFKLLMFRGKPCQISNKIYEQKDVDQYLLNLYNNIKIDQNNLDEHNQIQKSRGMNITDTSLFNLNTFKEELSLLYHIFVQDRKCPKLGNIVKQYSITSAGQGNWFANVFFDSNPYRGKLRDAFPFLFCTTLFPLQRKPFGCVAVKKSIIGEAARKLTSFQEIQRQREKEKEALSKQIEEISIKDGGLMSLVNQFYADKNKDTYFNGFTKDNLKSLRNFFKNNLKALRTVKEQYGKDFQFASDEDVAKHKIKTGYPYRFVNDLYSKYSFLWEEHKTITKTFKNKKGEEFENCLMLDRQYQEYIFESFKYHFRPHVNVSLFKDTGKSACLLFGSNYISYKLELKDGQYVFVMKDPSGVWSENNSPEVEVKVRPNGYLNNLKIIAKDKKKSSYQISFNTATQNPLTEVIETTYTGFIKEPKLRYDYSKGKNGREKGWVLDLSISDVESQHNKEKTNPEDLRKVVTFYKTSASKYRTQADNKTKIPYKNVNVTGVDLGLTPVCAIANYNMKVDPNGIDIGGYNVSYKLLSTHRAKNFDSQKTKKIEQLYQLIENVDLIIRHSRSYLNYLENEKLGKPNRWKLDLNYAKLKYEKVIQKYSNFETVEEYFKYVETVLSKHDPKEWKKKSFGWLVGAAIVDVKKQFSKMRSSYFTAKNKQSYVRNDNFVSNKDILKIKTVKAMIDLLNSYTFLGMSDEDRNNYHNSVNESMKDLWRYLNGIRKYISKNVASIIVHHAIKNNSKIIFIEELDLIQYDYMNTKEDNRLRSLWGAADMISFLNSFANKHGIAVCKVNPVLTSQIDAETFELGLRSDVNKTNLYVKRDNNIQVVDSDVNAAKNVAIRGITRHAIMPQFEAIKVSDKEFVLNFKNKDMEVQKQGAMMNYLKLNNYNDIKYLLFTLKDDNTLEPKQINKEGYDALIKKQKDSAKLDRVYIIRSGELFYLRSYLNEVVAQYKVHAEDSVLV